MGMGMASCCISIKEDLHHEIRKEAKMVNYETKETDDLFRSIAKDKSEQIIFEIKDNQYEEYSKQVFQRLNMIRCTPALFFKENNQYSHIGRSLGISNNDNAMQNKGKLLTWSTKKARKISDYLQYSNYIEEKTHDDILNEIKSLFANDFMVNGYYSIGNLDDIDEALLSLFSNTNVTEWQDIVYSDYSYCIIHSDYHDKKNIISYILFLNVF